MTHCKIHISALRQDKFHCRSVFVCNIKSTISIKYIEISNLLIFQIKLLYCLILILKKSYFTPRYKCVSLIIRFAYYFKIHTINYQSTKISRNKIG